MLRFVLLLLYLFASYSTASQTADAGSGYDPDGASLSPPATPTSDAGSGYDPNG